MGTRGLLVVVKDGAFKVAQYMQFDSYPEGVGSATFNFIKNEMTPQFRYKVDLVKELSDSEVEDRWKQAGADGSGLVSMDVVERFNVSNAHLDRSFGAKILSYIQNADLPEVYLSTSFAADSLFCEWAYVIDLDNDILEVYKGFNKIPLLSDERFKSFDSLSRDEYYPVRLVTKTPFSEIESTESSRWAKGVRDALEE